MEREKGVQLRKEGQERRLRKERKMELYGRGGGGELEGANFES